MPCSSGFSAFAVLYLGALPLGVLAEEFEFRILKDDLEELLSNNGELGIVADAEKRKTVFLGGCRFEGISTALIVEKKLKEVATQCNLLQISSGHRGLNRKEKC